MKLTNEEKLIKYLNKRYKNSNKTTFSVCKNDLSEIKLTEQEFIKSLDILKHDSYLKVEDESVHGNLNKPCRIRLYSSCISYFQNKKLKQTANRRDWIRVYIPICLSILSIIISIISLLISFQT